MTKLYLKILDDKEFQKVSFHFQSESDCNKALEAARAKNLCL